MDDGDGGGRGSGPAPAFVKGVMQPYKAKAQISYVGKRKHQQDDDEDDDDDVLAPGVKKAFGGVGAGRQPCWQGWHCKSKSCRYFHPEGRQMEEAPTEMTSPVDAGTATVNKVGGMQGDFGFGTSSSSTSAPTFHRAGEGPPASFIEGGGKAASFKGDAVYAHGKAAAEREWTSPGKGKGDDTWQQVGNQVQHMTRGKGKDGHGWSSQGGNWTMGADGEWASGNGQSWQGCQQGWSSDGQNWSSDGSDGWQGWSSGGGQTRDGGNATNQDGSWHDDRSQPRAGTMSLSLPKPKAPPSLPLPSGPPPGSMAGSWGSTVMASSLRSMSMPATSQLPPGVSNSRSSAGSASGSAFPVAAGRISVMLVAEKPVIARALATALAPKGDFKTEKEFSSIPTFTFKAPWCGGDASGPPCLSKDSLCLYRVTSTVGHIYSLDFPEHTRRWRGVDPESLFDSQTVYDESRPESKVPRHLANEAGGCHLVILCLDCDREGEAIGYECLTNILPALQKHGQIHVGDDCGADCKGRDFKDDARVWRARFSSLAPADLKAALANLQKPNPLESRAVDARQEIDLKVGVSLTRLITSNLRDVVGTLAPPRGEGEESQSKGALLSYGPCQTPTLNFCVEQWDLLQQFKKETGFTLDLQVRARRGEASLSWDPPPELASRSGAFRERGTTHREQLDGYIEQVSALLQGEQASLCEAECVANNAEERRVERPCALNTVELLKAGSRELGMDPQTVMAIAEKLYLNGLLTYPRTETTRYPRSLNIRGMLEEHVAHPKWGQWCQRLLQGLAVRPREGFEAGDHPPITPVCCASEADLRKAGGVQATRLYELVVLRFLASVSPDVRYMKHECVYELCGARFIARGTEVKDWGFSRICKGAVSSAPNAAALHSRNLIREPATLEVVQAMPGQRFPVAGLAVRELVSQPPRLLTEAELLAQMEKNGIGTDASMPQHVGNVVQRGYVEVLQPGRRMRPTLLGCALVYGLREVDLELTKAAVRARIENDVSDVAKGLRPFTEVVSAALVIFREKFRNVRSGMNKLVQAIDVVKAESGRWEDSTGLAEVDAEEQVPAPFVIRAPEPAAGSGGDADCSAAAASSTPAPAAAGVPEALADDATEEELLKEQDVLKKKLQIAQLKAENAELKLRDMQRKYSELELLEKTLMAQHGRTGGAAGKSTAKGGGKRSW
eukprot:TRINITY_DN120697_c0_g1_i1.p1 TRINITY_DN120697_c0_g1~~TRINITY_DN120697_c0_g1_i1.p1  ORF type:complete len:1186 (-),score=246.05 TRINITY_DN120697_c0_g1_i1:57-3614(-)